MPGAQIRWRGLRRRGTFPDPSRDLPQWESQILDSLGSLATASAERWIMAGPVSGSSGSAVQSALGQIQPSWMLRIAPTGITCDIALPDIGTEGTGRQIAVQHTGATRSALRLEWGGSYLAACTSPGQIAVCVWDGNAWRAISGRVEWRTIPASHAVPLNASASPLVQMQVPVWGQSLLFFPSGAATYTWSGFAMPADWIGTAVQPEVIVTPMVSATATAKWEIYYEWQGVESAPIYSTYGPTPPANGSQTGINMSITAANYGQARRIAASVLPTPLALSSTLDGFLLMGTTRRGDLDNYNTAYNATANNIALMQQGVRAQCCYGDTVSYP